MITSPLFSFFQGMVARLPDKGEKLKSELYKIRKAERTENQVIDLDSLSGDLQRVLNV